jgi:hypothetical protein
LSALANHYAISSGGGSVTLQYNGAPVTAGEFGVWTPIGAALTATGYDVAWEVPGANQYTVWQIDSSGKFISSLGLVAGNDPTLVSYETVFNQDFNGNGAVGSEPIATSQSADALPDLPTDAALISDAPDTTPVSFGGGASSSGWLALFDPALQEPSSGWGWDDFNAQSFGGEPPQNGSLPLYSLSDFDFVGDPGSAGAGASALQPSLPPAGAAFDPAGSNGIAVMQPFGAPSLSALGVAGPGAPGATDNSAVIEPLATSALAMAGLHHM